MNISREQKKCEALTRMKMWGIYLPTCMQFEKEDLVSESAPPLGACFWLDAEQLARVIHCFTTFGELENYLYVSDHPEEWEDDRNDIKSGQQLVYVVNKDMPDCSEFGSIGIAVTAAAGLRRTW